MTSRGASGRGRPGSRGRPRKGIKKRINEKKLISDLKKELALRVERVKEFGFIEAEAEIESEKLIGDVEPDEEQISDCISFGRTRSGRLSIPPKKMLKNMSIRDGDDYPEVPNDLVIETTGAVTNMNVLPPPVIDSSLTSSNKRTFAPPARYVCKVCGKLYLGDKKIARHLKNFPDHEFATPDPPDFPVTKKPFSIEAWVNETEVSTILDTAGEKIFQSCTLWDILAKKVSLKQLGTAEIISSLFADIQALVMDLKNMVEQCLSNIQTNEDSFSVILTPMISSILGQSQDGGGVKRYVLPYNQIPIHYHKLLGFPMDFRNSQSGLLSPDSTNSIFQPEEENSQMSLSSDIVDRPLVDKVVLETNLGAEPDLDDETQDSTRMKRPRMDSESRSLSSPPSQTPDFLNHDDESNLSSTSNTCTKEVVDDIPAKQYSSTEIKGILSPTNITKNDVSSHRTMTTSPVSISKTKSVFTDSTRTRLPSFSSIMCGNPKTPLSISQNSDSNADIGSSLEITNNLISVAKDSSLQPVEMLPSTGHGAGGSAPVSPGIPYQRSLDVISPQNMGYQRRSSVDQILLNSSSSKLVNSSLASTRHEFSQGKGIDLTDSLDELNSISLHSEVPADTTRHNAIDSMAPGRFRFHSGRENVVSLASPTSVTSLYQTSDNAVYNVTSSNLFSATKMSGAQNSFLETPPKENISASQNMNKNQESMPSHEAESCTQVTFSDLNHPIPSVSPIKNVSKDYDMQKPSTTPRTLSQSPNLFSDIESVLNQPEGFGFHSTLSNNVVNVPSKTPEKMLASVPPSVIMNKKSSMMLFNSFEEIDTLTHQHNEAHVDEIPSLQEQSCNKR